MVLVTQPADGLWGSMPRSNNARQGRSLISAILENADATPQNGTRSGVIVTTGLTQASDLLCFNVSGLTVQVAPGIGSAHLAGQGPQLGFLNSVKTITVADPPASNPRNDIIILRMLNLAGGDVSVDGQPCRIEVVTGTPGAVPVDPVTANANGTITAIPAQAGLSTGGIAIPLGRAQVSTGGVITLTDIRKSTGAPGAVRYMLPGDAGDTAGRTGQLRYTQSTDLLEIRDRLGTWQQVLFGNSLPRGVVAVGSSSTGSPAGITTADLLQAEIATGSVITGRRYRINHIRAEAAVGGPIFTNRYRVQAGGSITVGASTLIKEFTDNTPGSFRTSSRFFYWVSTITGTATFGLSSFVNANTGSINGSIIRDIVVEDVGL